MSDEPKRISSEARRVVHLKRNWKREDTVIISVIDKYDDGSDKRYFKIITDAQRPYYITKQVKRTYKQKRASELKSNLRCFTCSESDLPKEVPRKLPFPYNQMDYRRAKNSPYLYGVDQTIEYLVKRGYNKGVEPGLYNYATFDIETDVLDRFDVKVLMVSIAMGKKVITYIQDAFLEGIEDPLRQLYDKANTHLAEFIEDGLEVEYVLLKGTDILTVPIMKLHEWKPDIVGIWNIDFDIPFLEKEMLKHNIKPEDVFTDPELPKELKNFYYKQGPELVTTVSGVDHRLGIHERWHVVYTSSYFEWVDAMCIFAELRSQEAKRPSYSLDAILKEFLDIGKLKFDEIENDISMKVSLSKGIHNGISKLNDTLSTMGDYRWKPPKQAPINSLLHHQIMQDKYKLEYGIYSTFDPYGMVLLDEKIKDHSLKLPVFMGASPVNILPKRTKRLAGYLHEYLETVDSIPGSSYTTYPKETIMSLSDWIITADAYLRKPTGTKCLKHAPGHTTSIYCNLLDVDLVSSYPKLFIATRASLATRYTTLGTLNGKEVTDAQKKAMVSWMHGPTNSADVSVKLLAKPSLQQLLERSKAYL